MHYAAVLTPIIVLHLAGEMSSEPMPPYEVTSFSDEPGIYFEKIGTMQLQENTWKLAIRIEVAAFAIRYHQLQHYLGRIKNLCDRVKDDNRVICNNILRITEDDNTKLTQLIIRLQTIYKVPTSRRGLLDAIGTISKTLFGTMDADDEKHIQEQLELMQNQQNVMRHAAKSQIKIINATLGHMEALEQTINKNENLLANVTRLVQERVSNLAHREEIDEHLLAITAIMNKLINDVEDVLAYLTYSKSGIVLVRLLPLENIITELREATTHLSQGAHFPFKIQTENWNKIQEFMEINAYYDNPNVYTILTFPIVTYPKYEIIRINPLPVHDRENIFVIPKTTYDLLAIDKENRNYVTLKEDDLNKCKHSGTTFVCNTNHPVYFITPHAPCEVQIYIRAEEDNCERRHILSTVTFWITLAESQAWLFSTPYKQSITIQCNNQGEHKIDINRTGRIKLTDNCKLTTTDLTLRTKKRDHTTHVQMHLPQFNLTFKQVTTDTKINNEIATELKIEP
ncbi:uncharacterized protein LOC112463592, partial [Temnothorax curvispinosus]|uniref:Uncharacterized protein LOC112463592 n=1 Tax=Temnothorax curvispinosus TaxID=300111 RepID=A0A6J1QTL8_9HYME